jgi:glycogen operon protein
MAMGNLRVWPGNPYPRGAAWDGSGVNVAIFSEHASKVELCLFDSVDSVRESHRIPLPERTQMIWHGYFPDLRPGQIYGFRVHGPYDPKSGHRFNPNKVVLDPYAQAIGRNVRWDDDLFGYRLGDPLQDLSFDGRDNAAHAPLAAVADTAFSWGDDRPLRIPWHRTVIYEVHVKGFTKLNSEVPEFLRGTYAGLASEAALRCLTDLGVTAVELMPVHQSITGRHLLEKGLTDYWGYNTLSYFAPDVRFARARDPQDVLREFKTMVRTLHSEGIEVILDVVYNHTGEGSHLGPTVMFRGVDNASYYRLNPEDRRLYEDFTGCGNTLNMQHPRVLQMVMDSLRYWVQEMHVDGFRFDLASALAREQVAVDKLSSFFDILTQDPVLSQVKLIAEPWDLGPDGYQVGNFPVNWVEWNGKYRDCVRRFWKGEPGTINEFATRLTGSSDLYEQSGRRPFASVNFVTSHDGFTLHDLVSYEEKHNEANGEGNRDGHPENIGWNCGVEGPTDDVGIRALRERQKRNFMATLLLSQGVPMIRAGDEIGHTQKGNNNPYCQDNELSWIDWTLDADRRALVEFTRRVISLWKHQPVLQRRKFFQGRPIRGSGVKDITWLAPSGAEFDDRSWNTPSAPCLGMRLEGDTGETDERGRPIVGETLLLLMNGGTEPVEFRLPKEDSGRKWVRVLDTAFSVTPATSFPAGDSYPLMEHSLAVLVLWESAEKA